MPSVQPDIPEEHWATQIYEAMVLRGIDPHDMTPNYEDEAGSHVVLAMPKEKVALATDGDVYDALIADGWQVTSIPVGAMKSYASTARELNGITTSYRVRGSSNSMIKTGSEDETRLLNGILRAHLPPPDRNFRIMREESPNQELAVPDFTWPRQRIAFFMDGLWWHVGRDSDVQKKVALGTANKEVLEEAEKQQSARATRDAGNRSDMAVMGWTVLSCTDEDITDERGVSQQVDRMKRALRGASERAGAMRNTSVEPTAHEDDDTGDIDKMMGLR